ncbi:MAG: DNA-binding protein [Segetibacter sp.]|jgi:transcriptional regulator with XRE-family HTH domain|nr:DNA-binding protein [Segetibacter sp.]
MKHFEIGRKIKELRLQLGISQDELAEMSQLSQRTIQRIENNETEPRGDSLKRISKALNANVEDLTSAKPREEFEPQLKENKSILFLMNFSALGFLIYPFLGIIFPMVVWIVYKDKITLANETGRKIMKFQVSWSVLLYIVYLYFAIAKFFHTGLNDKYVFLFLISLYIFNILFIFINIMNWFEIKKAIHRLTLYLKHRFVKSDIATISFLLIPSNFFSL